MNSSFLSESLQKVKPSATIGMSQKARALKRAGKDVIMLSQGEPDFETPDHIKEAGREALRLGHTRYTSVDGTEALKSAICAKFSRDNSLAYEPENINVSPGGKAVIFNALMATLNPGDEVIIPGPCWVSYPEMTRLCGGTPVVVPCDAASGYKLTPEALERAITPRSKWLILNSPSNPTGVCLSGDELDALGTVLKSHPHVLILSDDIYEHLIYSGHQFQTLAQRVPRLKSRILAMNGLSKAYAMTGWRLGYGAGPKWLIDAMRKVMSQTTSNPSSISQWASIAALNGSHDFLGEWRAAFEARRDMVLSALGAMGIICPQPGGAFYVFGKCERFLGGKISTDSAFTESLLNTEYVALVPGSAFHAPGHFRLSFASDMETLERALDRLGRFCQTLA